MRYACRAAVVAALQANSDLTGVQVEHCWPGDQMKDESIWLNPTLGESSSIPAFRGPASTSNPVMLDDKFTIPLEVIVSLAGTTPAEAEARLGELQRAVVATITASPDLATFTKPTGWELIAATCELGDGPGTVYGREGGQSYAEVIVHVHARKS